MAKIILVKNQTFLMSLNYKDNYFFLKTSSFLFGQNSTWPNCVFAEGITHPGGLNGRQSQQLNYPLFFTYTEHINQTISPS